MSKKFFHSLLGIASTEGDIWDGPDYIRVAVPYEGSLVYQHFGKCTHFRIYDIEKGKVVLRTDVNTNGQNRGTLPSILKGLTIDVLICGGIGPGAIKSFNDAGIKVYGGVYGETDKVVNLLIQGRLEYNPDKICEFHGQHSDEGADNK